MREHYSGIERQPSTTELTDTRRSDTQAAASDVASDTQLAHLPSPTGGWAGTGIRQAPSTDSLARHSLQSIIDSLQPKATGSSFREEARLEATPLGETVAPASLAPSSKTPSHSSVDNIEGVSVGEDSPSAPSKKDSEAQRLLPVATVNLPGSADAGPGSGGPRGSTPDLLRLERVELPPPPPPPPPSLQLHQQQQSPEPRGASRHHSGCELLVAVPESTDYMYEEEELDRLARSPQFLSERAKDPGFTLLHFVAMLGHGMLADALPDDMMSRYHHFARLASCLISRQRVEVFATDKYGCTPLQLAAAIGNTEMVRVLLEPYDFETSGSEVLPQNYHGYDYLNHQDSQVCFSALHGAVNHNAHDAVILLLKHGANPQALDVTRKTAFEVAPSLVSLQELLRLAVQRQDEVPRSVIVQLMAVVLDKQTKEGGTQDGKGATTAVAATSGGGGGGPDGPNLQDSKGSRSFRAQQRWSKAARYATSAAQAPVIPAQRFTSAIIETIGNMHNSDVASTIRRHFGKLYEAKRYDVLVEYVILAINSNQYSLTEMMIERICNDCPDVLANSKWHETLEPLVCTYPTLFHGLLFKLQDMRDEDVRGFVRCLTPSTLQTGGYRGRPQSVNPLMAMSQRGMTKAHAVDRVKLLIYQQLVEGLKKVSYRIIKTFFEESDQRLLNDMAQFPIFAEFVGLVANMDTGKAIGESDDMRQALLDLLRPPKPPTPATAVVPVAPFANAAVAAQAIAGGDASTPVTRPSTAISAAAALPRPSDAPPVTMAWGSVDSRKVLLAAKESAAAPKVSFKLDAPPRDEGLGIGSDCGVVGAAGAGGVGGSAGDSGQLSSLMTSGGSGRLSTGGTSIGQLSSVSAASGRLGSGRSAGGGGGSSGGGGDDDRLRRQARFGSGAARGFGSGGESYGYGDEGEAEDDDVKRRRARLSLQTLNARPVLWAAVKAGKAYNVETTVMSIVSWVETNSKDGKAVFVAGITADLIQELAMRFPSACATLLNLVSKDVLEQLDTLQVSANVLYGKDHLVKCSHVRNHFTWREQELRKLITLNQGYNEHVVDALVDYGVPFECVYKAAVEMGATPQDCATPEHFAALIEHGFTGPELKQLISNGIRLAKVIGYIEECAKPPPDGVGSEFVNQLNVAMPVLLRDMLKERLSPRIVDIILREEKMFETTKYNNFRPGRPLRKVFPERLFVPKYTHHFVQMLLIMWQRGNKDGQGRVTLRPWAKEFIDTVFELNDPLSTKLKSAYDNKLTDTQVYIQGGDNPAAEGALESKSSGWLRDQQQSQVQVADEEKAKQAYIRQLLRIFIGNNLLIHRWPVYLAAHLWVFLDGAFNTYWQRLEALYYRKKARRLGLQMSLAKKARSGTIDAAVLAFPILGLLQSDGGDILTALVHADAPSSWFHYAIVRAMYGLHWSNFGRVMVYLNAAVQLQLASVFLTFFLLVLNYPPLANGTEEDLGRMNSIPIIQGVLCVAVVLSTSMLIERLLEARVPQLGTWVSFGRRLELCCHGMVWTVALIVWRGRSTDLVPALSGLTMLLFVARLTLFGLITEKLSTAVLALLEILSDSRYFFLLIALVYGGFVLAVAGLRQQTEHRPAIYTSQLFTVLLGDFQSSQLADDEERSVWRFPEFSLVLLSFYAMLMLIVFMNLLIATMNDTYDRVKEFREVEVMRLRSHMMVFVKDFIRRKGRKELAPLNGDVLHLLLRPEEVKSGRWLAQSGSEPSEYSAWAGRITYMRSTIVREVEAVMRSHAEKATEQLGAIQQRLEKLEGNAVAAAAAAAAATAATAAAAAAAPPPPPPPAAAGEQFAALEHRLGEMHRGLEALLSRHSAGGVGRQQQ